MALAPVELIFKVALVAVFELVNFIVTRAFVTNSNPESVTVLATVALAVEHVPYQ